MRTGALAEFVRPDGATAAWGVNSFAELPAHSGAEDLLVGEQIGYRMPVLKCMASCVGPGIWLAVADRDAVLTVPGSSKSKVQHRRVDEEGPGHQVPCVKKDCETLSGTFEWLFGECVDLGAMAKLQSGALRFAEQYTAESGFERFGGPMCRCMCRIASWRRRMMCVLHPQVSPDRVATEPHRSPMDSGTWRDLPGSPRPRDGLSYKYAARSTAFRQTVVTVWMNPAMSRSVRARFKPALASAMAQLFKFLRKGEIGSGRRQVPRTPVLGSFVPRWATWCRRQWSARLPMLRWGRLRTCERYWPVRRPTRVGRICVSHLKAVSGASQMATSWYVSYRSRWT